MGRREYYTHCMATIFMYFLEREKYSKEGGETKGGKISERNKKSCYASMVRSGFILYNGTGEWPPCSSKKNGEIYLNLI